MFNVFNKIHYPEIIKFDHVIELIIYKYIFLEILFIFLEILFKFLN